MCDVSLLSERRRERERERERERTADIIVLITNRQNTGNAPPPEQNVKLKCGTRDVK